MKKNLTTLFGAFMALALLASACGGGGGDDQAVIDALSAQINEDGDVPESFDLNCMSTALVEGLGGAQVMEDEYGLTPETIAAGQEPDDVELPVDDARALGDGLVDCGLDEAIIDEIAADGLAEDDAACLLDNIDRDAIRDVFAADFMSSADADRIGSAADESMGISLFTAIETCGISPEDIGF